MDAVAAVMLFAIERFDVPPTGCNCPELDLAEDLVDAASNPMSAAATENK